MNDAGHRISSLFISGSLAKNAILMQLISDTCNIPVQLPFSTNASVVLGAAMLGAAAARDSSKGELSNQTEASRRSRVMKGDLWSAMVKMSKSGKTVRTKASEKEKRLLEIKYKVFLESIDLQRRIKKDVEQALV